MAKRGYAIGKGRPPSHSRFRPGQSGNPKGRPKGALNTKTLIDQELDTKILITENGKQRKISKRQAAAKQFANKAASGDPKAIAALWKESRQDVPEHDPQDDDFPDRWEDRLVVESLIQRIRATPAEPAAGEGAAGTEDEKDNK
jgi:uncharacterized protein DUF5681